MNQTKKRKGDLMEINMMYYGCSSPYIPRNYREHFKMMKEMGVDSVNFNFLEGSLNWLKSISDIAHESGLRAYGMPGRIAGLFAAGPRPCSVFTLEHPESLMLDRHGKPVIGHSGLLACVNNPVFKDWFYPFMAEAADACDGILFDEPKSCDEACYCGICRKLAGSGDEDALIDFHRRSMADMMGKVAQSAKTKSPGKTSGVMLMPISSLEFTAQCAAQEAFDFVGTDGPLCAQSVEKEYISSSFPRYREIVRRSGKRTIALVETFCVSQNAHKELQHNLLSLSALDADIFSFNFYPHRVEAPDELMDIVKKTILSLRKP